MSDRIMQSEQNPVVGERPNQKQHPLANYQFSPDEIRVLKECNTESFFQRCLPLGTLCGVSTYYGVRQGYLTPNAKYGAVPKVVVSVIIGYFLGKFSYQNKCAEKMMELPNSKLGQLLRQKKGNKFYDTLPQQALGTGFGLPSFGSSSSDVYSDEGLKTPYKSSSLDLDTERPPVKELDDIYKPNLDSPNIVLEDPTPSESAKPSVSYDDLRRRNRENYGKPKSAPAEKPLQYSNQPIITGKPEEPEPPKNKYGDIWSS